MTDNKEAMRQKWRDAEENPGQKIPVGSLVVCDFCGDDWTDRQESGGMIFQSKAVCPPCTVRTMPAIQKHGEERFILARCPEGQSFADFVRAYRGPDAYIRFSKRLGK